MSLNNYQVKVLAATLMLVDHVGAVLFPSALILRILGRFSFPLFILLLVDGENYTRNVVRYGLRLCLLGVVSQSIYDLLFPGNSWNILFTLALGLICLRLVRMVPRWQVLIWLVGSAIAETINLEYGAYGIVAIALIRSLQMRLTWWIGWVALHVSVLILTPNTAAFQLPAVFAPLLLNLANHQPGSKARWFYLFYPLHLLGLWLIQMS
jgi:hypothetical protein